MAELTEQDISEALRVAAAVGVSPVIQRGDG
jgi:hypothetical protein